MSGCTVRMRLTCAHTQVQSAASGLYQARQAPFSAAIKFAELFALVSLLQARSSRWAVMLTAACCSKFATMQCNGGCMSTV